MPEPLPRPVVATSVVADPVAAEPVAAEPVAAELVAADLEFPEGPVWLEDGSILVVTDLPTGDSLRDVLTEKGAFSAAEVQSIGTTVLGGLSAVHAAGHIHGDIKPNAIHLTGEGPVLVDGGITMGLWSAKHLGDKTALIGTPFYAPVEQFGGEAPDISSDIYNVATVLYELATL